MNLFDPNPTRADVHFQLFGIAVCVSVAFWMAHTAIGLLVGAVAFLKARAMTSIPVALLAGVGYFCVWIGAAFISILIHELGHALVGRVFGVKSRVVLGLGGLATACLDLRKRGQRILVLLAGPFAQLTFAGVLWLVAPLFAPSLPDTAQSHFRRAIDLLLILNVVWPALNLLPIPPLDGGRVVLELYQGLTSPKAPPWERDPDCSKHHPPGSAD
jgi:Zn-dependent protease